MCSFIGGSARSASSAARLILLCGFALGCKVVIQHADDSVRDSTRHDTTVDLATFKMDTIAPVLPPIPPVVANGDVTDTTPGRTSAADLAMLSTELIIPLAGVKPTDLRDTFNEVRGGGTRKHEALDILAPRGTPVMSASSGRVLKLHNSKDGGLMVYAADSSDRFVLMYAHLDRYADGLRDSLPLRQGQVIGYVGTTGNAPPNTPHLHFAIAHPRDVKLWWTGTAIDPLPLLQRTAP
jgi:murein DD-endopeptidase MepM/ murein hydrolase activator NlpD